jgi:hypothetical protein
MNINKNEMDLHLLATQVLAACPHDSSVTFRLGFNAFVDCFFLDLDFCSSAISQQEGQFDIDLPLTIQLTLKTIKTCSTRSFSEDQKTYWDGVMEGVLVTERMLILAFDTNLRFEVA